MTKSDRAIVFVWDNFGPTHADRLDAVAKAFKSRAFIGIELVAKSETYDWVSEGGAHFRKNTLCHGLGCSRLKMGLKLVRALLTARPDIVFFCHYERTPILFAATMMRMLGIPAVTMIDSKFDDRARTFKKELVKRLFFIPYVGAIVGSARTLSYMKFMGFPDRRLRPGYDAIDVDRVRRNGAKSEPENACFDERHFTIIARLVPKKDISTALKAYARLKSGGSKRRLVICGSGPLERELHGEAAQLGIEDSVEFLGFVQTAKISEVLTTTLALIQPSIEEQFGISIAEAIAMGIPVIVSENCGARDYLVRSTVNGFVFEPGNVEGLHFFMQIMDTNQALWSKMSSECLKIAPEADVAVFVNSFEHLCKEAGVKLQAYDSQ